MITTGDAVIANRADRTRRTAPNRASMAMRVSSPISPADRVGGWPMITRPATAPNMMMTTASKVDQAVRIREPNTRTITRNAR